MSKAPGTNRLKLKYRKLVSDFADKFKLRRYIMTAMPEFDDTDAIEVGVNPKP
jgi:hypothetical protein